MVLVHRDLYHGIKKKNISNNHNITNKNDLIKKKKLIKGDFVDHDNLPMLRQ